jgi:hypothetical protein
MEARGCIMGCQLITNRPVIFKRLACHFIKSFKAPYSLFFNHLCVSGSYLLPPPLAFLQPPRFLSCIHLCDTLTLVSFLQCLA